MEFGENQMVSFIQLQYYKYTVLWFVCVCVFRPQHLSGLQLVSDLCSGSLQGATIGSTDISLTPAKIRSGNHTADTQTAG